MRMLDRDEASSREVDEPEYLPSMARDDLSDWNGYMADAASDVDSPRSAHRSGQVRSGQVYYSAKV